MAKQKKPNRKGAWFPFLLVGLVIVLGVVMIWAYQQWRVQQIDSYEDCFQAGYPILESYPEQCMTPDGRSFTRELSDAEVQNACEDLCGDGVCQEVVCQSLGCPCPETAESCPQDCE